MIKKTEKHNRMNYLIQEFDSIHDLMQHITTAPIAPAFKSREHSLGSQQTGRSWSGTDTFDDALDLLERGWTSEAAKLTKKIPVSTHSSTDTRTKAHFDVVGFQASVPRYLQGVPQNMVNQKRVVQKQKIVEINRDIFFNSGWSASRIEEEGIKAIQVVQAIENKGFRVRINVVGTTESGDEVGFFKICIKRPDQRLNLSKMSFPMAHTGFFRRIGFSMIEHSDLTNSGYAYSYGRADSDNVKPMLKPGEILLPSNIGDVEKFVSSLNLS